MKSDIIIIGAGASGLMAAYGAASAAVKAGRSIQVTVLEKMPRPGRKLMLTGKGRCNFTNLKEWNEFSCHIQAGSRLVKSAYYGFPSAAVIAFFESFGMKTVVERGDRAFPASYRSSDVVDTLVNACHSVGVKIMCEVEVTGIEALAGAGGAAGAERPASGGFRLTTAGGEVFTCGRLVVATGGLSYPGTGSTGDGYGWASASGHSVTPTFPSLTALVPVGYKLPAPASPFLPASPTEGYSRYAELAARHDAAASPSLPGHIDRSLPLSELGQMLCGIQLKNVQVSLEIQGCPAGSEFGDLDFTDGGIEGPVGFQLSRKAVKSMVNGSKVALSLDLKPAVELDEVLDRVKVLWKEVNDDPRSRRLREKEKCRILLGKLIPWELFPAFRACNPDIIKIRQRSRYDATAEVCPENIARALKDWRFEIAGFVGYERSVITAGGVSADSVIAKTLESRIVPGLYFCGEVLDVDADTGGYNLQIAFCTGMLAGRSAASI